MALVIHLMSAGRLQLFDTRASLRDRTSRLLVRLRDGRELRLREFGTRQRAWVKVIRISEPEDSLEELGYDAWPDPPELHRAARRAAAAVRAAARPARDRRDRALVGRRDPPHRPAVAVQARLRPRGGRGAPAADVDHARAGRRDRDLRARAVAAAARQAADAAHASTAATASPAPGAATRSRRSSTRTT